jgi:hypothetical protein
MRKPAAILSFERRLVQLGLAGPEVQRRVAELADHYEDLKQAALAQGNSESEADTRAAEQLGSPEALAEQSATSVRQGYWYGRHRLLAFCILPPLFHVAMLILIMALAFSLASLCLPKPTFRTMPTFLPAHVLQFAGPTFSCAASLATLIFFCRLARRSAAGPAWALVACGICAVHAFFWQTRFTPHSVALAYAHSPRDMLNPMIPLLSAALIYARQKRRERNVQLLETETTSVDKKFLLPLVLICLLPCLMTGCAGTKPVHEHGWVGGQYLKASPTATSPELFLGPAKNRAEALRAPKAGIQLEHCRTNTPVALAGLREGDIILEINHKPVKSLQQFHTLVDRTAPGTRLPVTVYRAGQELDYQIPVGRETYRNGGMLSLALPTVIHGWDLWPNPGFSLVLAGYEPDSRSNDEHGKNAYHADWSAWLVILELSKGRRIISQEPVVQSEQL